MRYKLKEHCCISAKLWHTQCNICKLWHRQIFAWWHTVFSVYRKVWDTQNHSIGFLLLGCASTCRVKYSIRLVPGGCNTQLISPRMRCSAHQIQTWPLCKSAMYCPLNLLFEGIWQVPAPPNSRSVAWTSPVWRLLWTNKQNSAFDPVCCPHSESKSIATPCANKHHCSQVLQICKASSISEAGVLAGITRRLLCCPQIFATASHAIFYNSICACQNWSMYCHYYAVNHMHRAQVQKHMAMTWLKQLNSLCRQHLFELH